MAWEYKEQPQSPKDLAKNKDRIKKLVEDHGETKEKLHIHARKMANAITKPEKAYNRGWAAKEMGYEDIFEIFYQRAYDLGTVNNGELLGVGVAEHRDHQMEKILKDL